MYLEMRQEADVRNDLCIKYKIDPDQIRNHKSESMHEIDQMLSKYAEDAEQALEQLKSPKTVKSGEAHSLSPTASGSITKLTQSPTFQQGSKPIISPKNNNVVHKT